MKKITVIYWSSTGNTELMAKAIAEGTQDGGNGQKIEVVLKHVSKALVEDITSSDLIALGCSAMGCETIDTSEMLPYIKLVKDQLKDKATFLFGSYDWGDGEWIQEWERDMEGYGCKIAEEYLMMSLTPDEEGLKKCQAYGVLLQNYVLNN